MKKCLFILALVPFIMTSCYEGDVGEREEYIVSGTVYFPDSTPIPYVDIGVIDSQYYSHALSGTMIWEHAYCGKADENGHFAIVIPDGGKRGVWVDADYRPTCDTAEVNYQYIGDLHMRYTGKHCFENLQIYTVYREDPIRYPYLIPSYPFIGDSVQVVAEYPITHIDLFEGNSTDNRHILSSVDYLEPDTCVMFYLPDSLSLETHYHLHVFWDNSGTYVRLHLRQH